jgi:hypothetical protein
MSSFDIISLACHYPVQLGRARFGHEKIFLRRVVAAWTVGNFSYQPLFIKSSITDINCPSTSKPTMCQDSISTALSFFITAQFIYIINIWTLSSSETDDNLWSFYRHIMMWNAWWLLANIILLLLVLLQPFQFVRRLLAE